MNDEWDEKAEHDRDLEYESRLADEQEHTDEPDPEREHKERMLKHGLDWINDNAGGTSGNKT